MRLKGPLTRLGKRVPYFSGCLGVLMALVRGRLWIVSARSGGAAMQVRGTYVSTLVVFRSLFLALATVLICTLGRHRLQKALGPRAP